jgi:predicted nucleotidyltransferase
MRYTQPLDDLLSSRARLRILRYLCAADGEHTGREIARAIGMGTTPTNQALRALADTFVVLYRVVGKAYYYRLNERHALVEQVLRPLFAAERGQRDAAIAELLAQVGIPLDTVFIYGSVARGEDTWRSDLDVLIVTPTEAEARHITDHFWQRDDTLLERYGAISIQALSRSEFKQRVQDGEPWLLDALQDSVVMRGASPQLLLDE